MPTPIFHVAGPTQIFTDAVLDNTLAEIGYTSNDDLPSYDEEVLNNPAESTRLGRVPADLIYLGRIGLLTIVLVEWDETELAALLTTFPTTEGTPAESQLGQVGLRWIGGGTDFSRQVRITPVVSGQNQYLFHRCIPNGGSGFRLFEIGNEPKQVGLQFMVLPNGTGPTATYYTKTAVA